ncbi:MAG: RNA polymerase factor sigma-54 [Phycisphaerae bacterium]|nr:RNA polymerase factor sigma-54 [Phycisphaerae bacterium]
MRFEASQHMKLGQHMKLAPRMIQSMEILQMPLGELQERIEQELENNPTLEIVEPVAEGEDGQPVTPGRSSVRERIERATGLAPRSTGERDAKMDAMASAPARKASLQEQLLEQWHLVDVKENLRALGELVISFLDDDGFLRTPVETIIDRVPGDRAKPTAAEVEEAIGAVQLLLEPAGVAARDRRECLLLQLSAMEAEPGEVGVELIEQTRTLIEHHLEDLTQNRLPRIAEKAGLTLAQIKGAMGLMRRLSLAPARQLVDDEPTPIVPDAIVEYDADHDRYIGFLNDSRMPQLSLNREYALMAKDRGTDKQSKEFLRTNLGNAQWLIDAVQQRKRTLERVIGVVVEAQREFFDYGPQALKPLPMTQVAEQLGIHVATVSRAVAEKYVQTPRGIVALRKFFTGGTVTESGEDVSWDAIRAALQDVIAAEDKARPLSDEALVEELKKRGIEIARRTIAKYRDQLKIPPARLRKAY